MLPGGRPRSPLWPGRASMKTVTPMKIPRRTFVRTAALASLAAPWISRQARAAAPKIRIGQIGTGHAHASGKLEAILKSDQYEFVGMVEPDPARRAGAEKNKAYAGLPWMTEEQLFNIEGLKAVAVETEVKDLVPTTQRCVERGLFVHMDKPAGESLPAFRHLLETATRKQVRVQLGYMLRYNPAFQLCFKLAKEGVLGDIFSIDTCMSKLLSPGERKRLSAYKGGALFELGCHVLDATMHLLGTPQKMTAVNRSVSAIGDGWLDNTMALLEYPKASAVVRSAMVEVEGGARRQFVVCGTKGTFDIRPLEAPAARLALDAPHGEYRKGYQDLKFPNPGGRYDGEFADLALVIRGEKKLEFSPEHDLAVHETLLKASGLPTT